MRSSPGGRACSRYAIAGLLIAVVIGLGAPMIARVFPIGAEAATFVLAAVGLVGIGYGLGVRTDALERTAKEDPVTRVGNRRHLDRSMTEELERSVSSRMPMSLIMLDVDNLKKLNDAHGHAWGDRALSIVGDVLLDTCRSRDVPARFGGDEFAIVLPRTRSSEARVLAERIRLAVYEHARGAGPLEDLLTVSIGIADLEAVQRPTMEELMGAADRALYTAKKNGRDRIEVVERPRNSGVISLEEVRAKKAAR